MLGFEFNEAFSEWDVKLEGVGFFSPAEKMIILAQTLEDSVKNNYTFSKGNHSNK